MKPMIGPFKPEEVYDSQELNKRFLTAVDEDTSPSQPSSRRKVPRS
jgi:hypothetical protein